MRTSAIRLLLLLFTATLGCSCQGSASKKVSGDGLQITEQTRDHVLQRIISAYSPEELNKLNSEQILALLSKEERAVFADLHWRFVTNKPALVSVMRHNKQETIPFWLTEKGFLKTQLTVTNENYEYEVWQKEFPAGEINLGINGFDLHRPVYFVTIGPVQGSDMPEIIQHAPDKWEVSHMEKGAYIYNDWDELVIKDFPKEIEGHILFTTIRGRARESAIQGCFRATTNPSSKDVDQIVLTWCADPATTQAIQWRTDPSVVKTSLRYWKATENKKSYKEKDATYEMLRDSYIYNNPEVKHWQINLSQLTPGTEYNYLIYNADTKKESKTYTFRTGPEDDRPFSFIYLGDTHNDDIVGPVLNQAIKESPNAAFLIHSGDHVNTGLFRDLWDKYFNSAKEVFPALSFAPTLGNHDSQDGLAPTLFTQLFMLPDNTDNDLPAERNYTFSYGNARFFMIDATGDITKIAYWLEKELSRTTEVWKIAVTHFPPYATDDSYPEIRESWCTLFDKYHVDLVLSGHVHQYFRSYPINNQQVESTSDKGTVYVSSVTVEPREPEPVSSTYNKVYANKGSLYQIIRIDKHTLDFKSKRIDNSIADQFRLQKQNQSQKQ